MLKYVGSYLLKKLKLMYIYLVSVSILHWLLLLFQGNFVINAILQ